jgi:hypothetical protein
MLLLDKLQVELYYYNTLILLAAACIMTLKRVISETYMKYEINC